MGMPKIAAIRPITKPQKTTRTVLDTIVFSRQEAMAWKNPLFQRPLRVNDKVLALAQEIKANGGVIPGIITLGSMSAEMYLLDGQHRREAFLISELREGFADVRTHFFDTMAEMGEEFVLLNSQLVRLRPDDILRGLEQSSPALMELRKKCPFIGYDQIRRGTASPILSMSSVIRCFNASAHDSPSPQAGSAASIATSFTEEDGKTLAVFLSLAIRAWGRDAEYARLWGNLNLALCMWLYRRTVLVQWSTKIPKLSPDVFVKCMMSLSADGQYVDWLRGRNLREKDRPPCYRRIKEIFVRRIFEETKRKIALPQPAWAG